MSDYCKECSVKIFGEDTHDLAGLCAADQKVRVLCEGCGGMIWVDQDGKKIMGEGNYEQPTNVH